jgi:CBS domain-containing protein
MQVAEIMRDHPITITELDNAARATQLMRQYNVGLLPVTANASAGKLIGIITDRDIVVRVLASSKEPDQVLVRDFMTKSPVSCGLLDDIRYAMLLMRDQQVRGLPVVDLGNYIVGIVTVSDLLSHFIHTEEIEGLLRSVSRPHMPVAS